MHRRFSKLAITTLGASLMFTGSIALAADMPARVVPSATQLETTEATISLEQYGALYADLLLTRAHFGVIFDDEVADLLEGELNAKQGDVTSADMSAVTRQLGDEITHFIVELRYVIEADGAVWPEDKPERTYRFDALAKLDQVRSALDDAFDGGTDPIDLLRELAVVNAWTEAELAPGTLSFSKAYRDSLLRAALPR